jgi:hypothetical protein
LLGTEFLEGDLFGLPAVRLLGADAIILSDAFNVVLSVVGDARLHARLTFIEVAIPHAGVGVELG